MLFFFFRLAKDSSGQKEEHFFGLLFFFDKFGPFTNSHWLEGVDEFTVESLVLAP
jgi:hypothetical protein